MKIIIHIILLILISLSLPGQRIDISNPLKMPSKTGKFKLIGKNNDGIVLRLYGTQDIISVFDNNLMLKTNKTIDFKNQDGLLQHIMLNKTGAVIFYLDQDKKYSVLYAQPVNSKFIEMGNPIIIDSILDRRDLVAANLRFKSSADQSNLLIYYPFFTSGKVDVMKVICLDRSLTQLYNKIIPVGRDESDLESSRTLVDNKGNAFIMMKATQRQDEARYDVFHISTDGTFSNYTLTSSKPFFSDPWFEIDNKNGSLVLTSFYDEQKRIDEASANGFLYASFNPENGTPIQQKLIPFSREFIAELTGRENVTNKSLYTFNIRRVILRNDGGAIIVAESFIKDTREIPISAGLQPGFNNYRTSEIYQFNDIIAFSTSSEGVLEWSSIMRKKQASEEDNGAYSSFLVMNEKDKIRLFFLDDPSLSGSLNQYVLNSTGTNVRETVINQEEKDLMLLPKMGRQVSPNELVMPSYKSNSLRLVKIAF